MSTKKSNEVTWESLAKGFYDLHRQQLPHLSEWEVIHVDLRKQIIAEFRRVSQISLRLLIEP